MKKRFAFSLLEMLVILISATLVGSMALHLMVSCVQSVNQRLSVVSRVDRLRLLQTVLERDIGSRFPAQEKASFQIGSASTEELPRILYSARVLIQETSPQVDLQRIEYRLDREDPADPGLALFRCLHTISQASDETSRILFRLDQDEALTWSASPEVVDSSAAWTRLRLVLEDRRYKDFPVIRDMILVGKAQ